MSFVLKTIFNYLERNNRNYSSRSPRDRRGHRSQRRGAVPRAARRGRRLARLQRARHQRAAADHAAARQGQADHLPGTAILRKCAWYTVTLLRVRYRYNPHSGTVRTTLPYLETNPLPSLPTKA